MNFAVSSVVSDGVATISLAGELDALSAPVFREEMNKITALSPKKLVLDMGALTFMASAGLRVLVYARQKFGRELPIYIVKPQEAIRETLRLTGVEHAVYIVDEAPTA